MRWVSLRLSSLASSSPSSFGTKLYLQVRRPVLQVSPLPLIRRNLNTDLIARSYVNCYCLQQLESIEDFWRRSSSVKHPFDFLLHHQLSLRFGSLHSFLYNFSRYASLRLLNAFFLTSLGVDFIVLPDVLSASGVRACIKCLL